MMWLTNSQTDRTDYNTRYTVHTPHVMWLTNSQTDRTDYNTRYTVHT